MEIRIPSVDTPDAMLPHEDGRMGVMEQISREIGEFCQGLRRNLRVRRSEEILARAEAVEKLQKEIANLPSSVRESFVLFSLEGFNSDETAMITGKEPADVLTEVEEARLELRKRLI